MKRSIAFVYSFFSILLAFGATATINRVWLEHGVRNNGFLAMKIHCSFSITGHQGKTGYVNYWIKGPGGDWHNVNGNATSNQGDSYFGSSFKATYYSTSFFDYNYAVNVDDLCLLNGTHPYSVIITIEDDHGNILAQSNDISFTATGAGSNTPLSNTPANYSPINNRDQQQAAERSKQKEIDKCIRDYEREARLNRNSFESATDSRTRRLEGDHMVGYKYSNVSHRITSTYRTRITRSKIRMRQLRDQARRYGYTITKSPYEDCEIR